MKSIDIEVFKILEGGGTEYLSERGKKQTD